MKTKLQIATEHLNAALAALDEYKAPAEVNKTWHRDLARQRERIEVAKYQIEYLNWVATEVEKRTANPT